LLGNGIHGTDVRQVHHHGLVAKVLQRSVHQVEVHPFGEHVGGNHGRICTVYQNGGVVTNAKTRGGMVTGKIFCEAANQAKFAQRADFCTSFHAAKIAEKQGRGFLARCLYIGYQNH
jgi:hypothetical protein